MKVAIRSLGTLAVLLSVWPAQELAAQEFVPRGPWKVERQRRGDTLVVRTLSGSVWGDRVRAVEELRIGKADGPEEETFGIITALTLFGDGSIAVFDQSVPALRVFDASGRQVRTLGREGAGPGEYRNASLGLAVDGSGNLMMYDPRNARLNRWKPDGTLLPSWRVPAGLYTSDALLVDTAGSVFIKVITEPSQPGKDWVTGLVRLDSQGQLRDTLSTPRIEGETSNSLFSPRILWTRDRLGRFVTGYGGVYRVLVHAGTTVTQIERTAPRITLKAAERRDYQSRADFLAANRGPVVRTGPPPSAVPADKPYFQWLFTDFDGRIWVRLHTEGEEYEPPLSPATPGRPQPPPLRWRERRVWDVFQADGTFLGQVELPYRTELMAAKGDLLWTTQRGEDDEQYVVRMRLTGALRQ